MATKVMVSFPDEFLVEVDRVPQEEHRSRSELLREAMRLYIGVRRGERRPGDDSVVRQAARTQDRLSRVVTGAVEGSSADERQVREALAQGYRTLAEEGRQIVRELQRRLAETMPIRSVRVFGSRARGDPAPDSDLDVFIELEKATPELRERISEPGRWALRWTG